eukprot:TRINITY_DN6479_c0_g1_i3.p1 TRINITY_DN6479_c0_g1~~TRINITY_DN6479_c0_g1_i3.p1  ORF type:complete len:159 (-),score=18.05 TRINITY_DN6479_c0_g1_i3:255-698(-)
MAQYSALFERLHPGCKLAVRNSFLAAVRAEPSYESRHRAESAPPDLSEEFSRYLQKQEDHDAGNCRPCAYQQKAEPCRWGNACDFCHLCPLGEINRRKKNKIKQIRTDMYWARKAARAAARRDCNAAKATGLEAADQSVSQKSVGEP